MELWHRIVICLYCISAWGYGIAFVTLIVIISNIGALLGPCMKSQIFKRILMFCVALAVGTLAATGLLVLIPEVVVILIIIWRPSSVRHNSVVNFFTCNLLMWNCLTK
jgi:hypothetical protein